MKKLKCLLLILLVGLFVLPFSVSAEGKEKIDIYFFYGDGCSYCGQAEEFFNSIDDDYKDMYTIKMYEVWSNSNNSKLMEDVASKMGEDPSDIGIPFIIIGDQSFVGYSSEYEEKIKTAIKNEYEKDDRYLEVTKIVDESGLDFTSLEEVTNGGSNNNSAEKTSKDQSSDLIITCIAIAIIAGFIVMIVVARKKTK